MQSDINPLMAAAVADYVAGPETNRRNDSSATWTTSSGDMGVFSDSDEIEDRVHFVDEYNRLAKKHGIRLLVKEDFDLCPDADRTVSQERKSSWFRTLLREFSGSSHGGSVRHASGAQSVRKVSSKRSLSNIATHLIHPRKDGFKDEDLQTLVRLCGKSKFYLPSDYAPGSLILPTCFRATAQYLVQHGTDTRGIFRISGSPRVVSAIYDHYCPTQDEADMIDTTVCSPNLPSYFKASVHDVASAFKKFLAGLPGGIIGSLTLFDAVVAIHSQLYADPEVNRTKQSKLRARLIALAIATLKSQYRRQLICAVFGLLSLVGRTAETAPREDGSGRPLPTSDLMGYSALGDIFGPLMVGNLLDSYTMKLANPSEGLILLPLSPPRSRRDRSEKRSKAVDDTHPPPIEVDKIQVARSVTEMIITHWREVVRHLKSLGALRTHKEVTAAEPSQLHMRQLRPSASESFMTQSTESIQSQPPSSYSGKLLPRQSSFPGKPIDGHLKATDAHEPLKIKRRRPKSGRTTANDCLTGKTSRPILSPTVEETGSPYPKEAGEQTLPMPSANTHLTAANQDSLQDPASGILLQTASPQTPAIPDKSSRRKKILKNGLTRAKKLRSEKNSQRADDARRDSPAPTLSRHDAALAWEQDHKPSMTVPVNTREHGIQPHEHDIEPESTASVVDWSDKHGIQHHVHDIQPDVTADATDATNKQQPPSRPTSRVEQRPELDVQTPFIQPGEYPQTPAPAEELSGSPYVYPGAYPPSPSKQNNPEPAATGGTTAATTGYSFNTTRFPFKTTPEEASNPLNEEHSPPGQVDKRTATTLGHSFKATLDEATNSLTRGVSSAVSALVEVFDLPSAGATSPTKIPAPHGSLRRNSRPSKHRRLQKRRSLDVTVPGLLAKDPEQTNTSSSVNNKSAQAIAPGAAGETCHPQPQTPRMPDDDGRAAVETAFLEEVRTGREDISRDMGEVHKEAAATYSLPIDTNLEIQQPADQPTVNYNNAKTATGHTSAEAHVTDVGGSKAHNDVADTSRTTTGRLNGSLREITAIVGYVVKDLLTIRSDVTGPSSHSAGTNLGSRPSVKEPVGSYFPSNDGNHSSAISNTARDQAAHAAGTSQDEKVQTVAGDFPVAGKQGVIPENLDARATEVALEDAIQHRDLSRGELDHILYRKPDHRATTERRSENPQAEDNIHGKEGPILPPQDQHHSDASNSSKANHLIDVRPQRSVRRLSHIFKGIRRSSTLATPPSATNRRSPHHMLSTPSLKHIRRSSTSAASPSQTPMLPGPVILGGPGRMTPYQEHPPVAAHLVRKLPPRSATPSMETLLPATTAAAAATPGTAGSNAALYNQVLALQRQVTARTEEVTHLSRQLAAVGEGGGAGTLSERLRVAERDVKMWRHRALAAERRVVVFERFLGRVRELRQKRTEGREGKNGEGMDGGQDGVEGDIERQMKAMDGAEKMDGGESGQLDGVVGRVGDSGEADVGDWLTAAKEVLEYDDERRWMGGSC